MKETIEFNSMIESFECDFSLFLEGKKKLDQIDFNSERFKKDFELLKKLSWLLRNDKAKIFID